MKPLISMIALLVCFTASAQNRYATRTLIATNAATCAATSGTNVAVVFEVGDQPSVPVQIELMASASGAYTFTIPFQYSVDGVAYANMAAKSISISFNGVTKQTIVTNVPTYGAGWMKIPYLTNHTASINVTNIEIKAPINWKSPTAL